MSMGQERTAVVIEDDADVRNLLAAILNEAGFHAVPAATGIEGINAVREHDPILTTLDVSLPGIDGFEVARRIRSFSDTYVIMLSARNEEIDTLMGLDAGADDYLTKPFRPRELRARIEAMMRRRKSMWGLPRPVQPAADTDSPPSPVAAPAPAPAASAAPESIPDDSAADSHGWLTHNGLRINGDMWLCDLDGAPVELTRSEFDLLLTLMAGKRRVISKDTLALELRGDAPGGYVSDSDRRAVEVHMANLRRKLSDNATSPRYIETVRGVGYRIAEQRAR
ncbi:MAG: response regulator transcription factor [Microlunatus sp.]